MCYRYVAKEMQKSEETFSRNLTHSLIIYGRKKKILTLLKE